MNGGTCTDAVNRRICECAAGYTGVNCETSKSDINYNWIYSEDGFVFNIYL